MEKYASLVAAQRDYFATSVTKHANFRLTALEQLRRSIRQNEDVLMAALRADLNKSAFESYSSEIGFVLNELGFAIKHLRSWMKQRRVRTPLTHIGSRSYIVPEPFGRTLIISPWNYPFQLTLAPLIGAIAAGNCAIIKPSEFTPETSAAIGKLIAETFPEKYITVVQGGPDVSQGLLKEKFDYIFFTGSERIGRVVMQAASEYLTPVTLELGGKSPAIVHKDANIRLAARRMAWGKFLNAGQTCIAPDYAYVHKEIKDEFLKRFQEATIDLYGESPLENPLYTRIVSEGHFDRLLSLMNAGQRFMGGGFRRNGLTIEPTVLTDINWDHHVMSEEIFGPILPVLEYDDLSTVLDGVRHAPNPLSLYLFTRSKQVEQDVLTAISFGGGCVNDTVYHFASPYLPFGGVGSSGTGAYHGKGSFDTFSHRKSILKQTTLFDLPFRYPNTKNGLQKIKRFLK